LRRVAGFRWALAADALLRLRLVAAGISMAARPDAVLHLDAVVRWAGLAPPLQLSHVGPMVAARLGPDAVGLRGIVVRPSVVLRVSGCRLRSKELRPRAAAQRARPVGQLAALERPDARPTAVLRLLQVSRLVVLPLDARLKQAQPEPLFQKLELLAGEPHRVQQLVPLKSEPQQVAQLALPQPEKQSPGAC
jgi:hypothetical protein